MKAMRTSRTGGLKQVIDRCCLVVFFLLSSLPASAIDHSQLYKDALGGDDEAQYTLAHLYLKGFGGVKQDAMVAVSWFEKAAHNGHRDAAYDLAMLYIDGKTVAKNVGKALFWINQAADMDHTEAQYYLGLAYKKSDPQKAVSWLKRAAFAGHLKAAEDLRSWCNNELPGCD